MIAPGVIYILTGPQNYRGISADLLETRRGIIDEFPSPPFSLARSGKIQLPIRDTMKHISLTLKEITRHISPALPCAALLSRATRARCGRNRDFAIINRTNSTRYILGRVKPGD